MNARWFLNNFFGSSVLLAQNLPSTLSFRTLYFFWIEQQQQRRTEKLFCLPFNFLISFVWSNIKLIFDPTHFSIHNKKKHFEKLCCHMQFVPGGPKKSGEKKPVEMVKWQHWAAWRCFPCLFICLFWINLPNFACGGCWTGVVGAKKKKTGSQLSK